MPLPKFVRRLLSLSEASKFWAENPPAAKTRLGLQLLEDRTTPLVNIVGPDANGIMNVTNNAVAENVTIDTTTFAGFITFTTTTNVPTFAAPVVAAPGGNAKIPTAGVKAIDFSTPGGGALGLTANSLVGATELRSINYVGGAGNETVDLTAGGNPNVYYSTFLESGVNTFKAANLGVNVLYFSQGATGSVTVTPSATNNKTALGFAGLDATTPVSANLNVGGGGSLASYGGMNVTLAAGGDNTKIIGVYGGKGNDTLIGNNADNFLIGFEGDDTLVGNGGNDQLNANRDFSPSMPGPVNVAGVATFTATTVIDISTFAAIAAANAAVPGQNASGAALYTAFGFFSTGEGVAALGGAGGLNGTSLGADFATANALTATASNDTLVGGDGNDGHYGFNNARVSATGGAGNDVFSTNIAGLASTYDGGDGNDLLIGAAGFTLLGGAGNDDLSFAVATPSATQANQSTASGGAGNDSLSVAFRNITIDAGEGTDTVGLGNFGEDVLVFNGTTVFTGGIGAFPEVKKVQR